MIKLLLVDDNQQNLYLLQVLLSSNGYEVQSASDGIEALEKARQTPPDLVISDILMPKMDGFSLCRAWKTDERLKVIPFIFYTATYTDPKDEEFALSLGAERFIIKPQEPNEFLALLKSILKNHQTGQLNGGREPVGEVEYYKEYNAALIRKLQDKVQQLEEKNRALELDIVERKQVEEALQISETKYRKLHESMIDGFVYVDMQGRIQEFNQSYQKMLGYDPEELARLTYTDLTPEKWHDFEQRIVEEQILPLGYSEIYQKEYQKKDGAIFPVELRTFLVKDDSGSDEGMWAIVRDITERKRAEEEIRRWNTELEFRVEARTRELHELQEQLVQQERMAVLGQLAGGMGHELRNPLAVINNAVYFLKLTQPQADEKVQEYLGMIEREIHNADKIINDLLDFARIQAMERAPTSVEDLVAHVLERFPAPQSVHVTLHLPGDLPPVYADPRQAEQLFSNLVVNACQAMPEGGKLTISARAEGEQVAIVVKDTGVGIPLENLDKIFEPLFTTKPKGIGLGLAVSQKLAEANQGWIEVASQAGKGATFTLFLPTNEGGT